jgi:hypothetical protein
MVTWSTCTPRSASSSSAGTADAAAGGLLPGRVVSDGAAREGGHRQVQFILTASSRAPNLSLLPLQVLTPAAVEELLVDVLGASLAYLLQSLVVRLMIRLMIRHMLPAQ